MQGFIESSLMITLSSSASFSLHVSSAAIGTGCSISLPLLKVIIDFTSSNPELLDDPTSWTPLLDLAMFGKGTFLSPVPPEYC